VWCGGSTRTDTTLIAQLADPKGKIAERRKRSAEGAALPQRFRGQDSSTPLHEQNAYSIFTHGQNLDILSGAIKIDGGFRQWVM
jgi:hypothetical protein